MELKKLAHVALWLTGAALLFVAVPANPPIHRSIDRDAIPVWGDHAPLLLRDYPEARFLGRVHRFRGGVDVYDCGPSGWRLVGPGRRFTPCTPDTVMLVSDQLVNTATLEALREDDRKQMDGYFTPPAARALGDIAAPTSESRWDVRALEARSTEAQKGPEPLPRPEPSGLGLGVEPPRHELGIHLKLADRRR